MYDDLQVWSKEGLIRATKAGKIGYLNSLGQEVVPFLYENGYSFSEGLAAVQKDNKWGFINMAGQVVIPFQFQGAYEFQKGLSPVSRDGELCLINRQGAITMATGMPYVYFNTVLSETHLFIRLEKAILLWTPKATFPGCSPTTKLPTFLRALLPFAKPANGDLSTRKGKK
ncbi:MAG: WG repeat-containing protein [Haliscomenobacter sp.]|nr:WG repeat-containing protein [Haliscomenobacter sp.]